jgi:hypothetical protein
MSTQMFNLKTPLKRGLVVISVLVVSAFGFGKNKATYEHYVWNYLKTPHFDVYFHQDQGALPRIAAQAVISIIDSRAASR